jgi:transcriptional regulator with XRE-family HTH domain
MNDLEQKEVFSRNLNRYLSLNNITQREVANSIGVSTQTFNTWCKGKALPRMGKVQRIADYFGISKSDLIDDNNDSSDCANVINVSDNCEKILLSKSRLLNDEGKRKLIERADELRTLGYVKEDSQKMA